jgi:hypothetical protein
VHGGHPVGGSCSDNAPSSAANWTAMWGRGGEEPRYWGREGAARAAPAKPTLPGRDREEGTEPPPGQDRTEPPGQIERRGQIQEGSRQEDINFKAVHGMAHRQRRRKVQAHTQPVVRWQVPSAERVTTKLKALVNYVVKTPSSSIGYIPCNHFQTVALVAMSRGPACALPTGEKSTYRYSAWPKV